MKKLISAILMLALSAPVFAQTAETSSQDFQKWTVKATAGYFPTVPILVDIFGAMFVGIAISAGDSETMEISTPPYAGLEGLYSFNKRWSVGGSVGYLGTIWKIVDKDTKELHSKTNLTFIPFTVEGRCNYLSRPAVKLYGSLELGALFSVGDGFNAAFDFQVNPFGVEFGRKFFGAVEFGLGMHYTGARIGLGYRF